MFLTNRSVLNKNEFTRLIDPKQINLFVCRPLHGLKPPFQSFELDSFSWRMYRALCYKVVVDLNLYVKKGKKKNLRSNPVRTMFGTC